MKDSPTDFQRFLSSLGGSGAFGLGMHGMSDEELEQRQMGRNQLFAQDQARAQSSYYDALRGMGGNFGQGVAAPPPETWCDHGQRKADCLACKMAEGAKKVRRRAKGMVPEPAQRAQKAKPGPRPTIEPKKPAERQELFPGGIFVGDIVLIAFVVAALAIAGMLWL